MPRVDVGQLHRFSVPLLENLLVVDGYNRSLLPENGQQSKSARFDFPTVNHIVVHMAIAVDTMTPWLL